MISYIEAAAKLEHLNSAVFIPCVDKIDQRDKYHLARKTAKTYEDMVSPDFDLEVSREYADHKFWVKVKKIPKRHIFKKQGETVSKVEVDRELERIVGIMRLDGVSEHVIEEYRKNWVNHT